VLFAALTFGKWRRERWRRLAHDLWRYLLVAAVLVTAFFFFIALLTRLAFGADPSPLVRWVSVARGLAAALAGWLVWRRRDTASALSPGPLAVLHLGGCRPTRIARACWMASRAPWARMRGASVVIDVTGRVAPRCLSGTHPNHAAHRSRAARGTKPPGEVRGRSASAHPLEALNRPRMALQRLASRWFVVRSAHCSRTSCIELPALTGTCG